MKTSDIAETLQTAVARELLASSLPARLSFAGPTGAPHVAPIWFLWRDEALVMCSRADSFKVRCLQREPRLAISIDEQTPPYKVLRLRGRAALTLVDGAPSEYRECAHRYYGREVGERWFAAVTRQPSPWALIRVQPDWVEAVDFVERFPWLFNP